MFSVCLYLLYVFLCCAVCVSVCVRERESICSQIAKNHVLCVLVLTLHRCYERVAVLMFSVCLSMSVLSAYIC